MLMTYEQAVQELEQPRNLQRFIRHQDERIECLETVIQHQSTDVVKLGSGGGEGIEAKLVKLADLRAKRDKLRVELCRREAAIIEAIGSLEDVRYSLILEKYYIDGLKLEEICVDMNYSFRHLLRCKRRAIEAYRVMRSCF